MAESSKAIVLASGGLDSYVTSHYVKRLGKEIKLLFFDYGQKALREEFESVKKLKEELNCELEIVELPWLGKISTSMINKNGKQNDNEILRWYVPCRNSVFLISALAFAESEFIKTGEESEIYIGIKHEGELQFKDTTKEFIEKMNELSKETIQRGFKIIAPFIDKDKEDIIELGEELGVDLSKSYSCYVGTSKEGSLAHCGVCAGCLARKKGFKFSNIHDNSLYESEL